MKSLRCANQQCPVRGYRIQFDTGVDLKPVSIPDRCQAETGVKLKPNIFDDLKENNHHHQRPKVPDDDPAHLEETKEPTPATPKITG